jgi:hypothetical protein
MTKNLTLWTGINYKIPPNLPLPKGGINPLFGKEGRFFDKYLFNHETINNK